MGASERCFYFYALGGLPAIALIKCKLSLLLGENILIVFYGGFHFHPTVYGHVFSTKTVLSLVRFFLLKVLACFQLHYTTVHFYC